MKISPARAVLSLVSVPFALVAAEKPSTKEEIKALVLEDARKAAKSPPPSIPKSDKAGKVDPARTDQSVPTPAVTAVPPTPAAAAKPAPELEAKLPQVEVNKSKVTQLDHDLHEQDRKMAFEARNAKATELDGALNAPGVNVPILGGYSSKVRTGLAQERLELMEFEKELTEAIARTKSKEEKAALKKELEDIRTMRRTLEGPADQKTRGGK
ncbi:MAG: hypothetical protein ABIZ81_07765 [Opitutaceae bacterium]